MALLFRLVQQNMKLHMLSAKDALAAPVDMICVPANSEHIQHVYDQYLKAWIPTLPKVDELTSIKSNPQIFHIDQPEGPKKVLLFYEGQTKSTGAWYSLCKKFAVKVKNDLKGSAALLIPDSLSDDQTSSVVNGWATGHYDLGLFKQQDDKKSRQQADVYILNTEQQTNAVKEGFEIAEVLHDVMTLVNLPANYKSPDYMEQWAKHHAAENGYKAEALDTAKMADLGMGAILSVNRGSESPAKLVITHFSHPSANKKVTIVGKGVLFDTGGLSIKDSKNMHYMKSDMAGGAVALGVVDACARLNLPVDVRAVVPFTDNSVDAKATKPGDVVVSYSGKSIEIIDTDAEGRLVLADALSYASKNLEPDVIIDVATLTGNIIAALGNQAAGLFTVNDSLAASIIEAGQESGERVWRMPMFEEYLDDMQSDVADLKNLSDRPVAGAATASKFLEQFTLQHKAWAHLDIAGMGFQPNGFGKGYCATGFGIRLLLTWLRQSAS